MKIESKQFEELTNKELYAILNLRTRVFVVEQECAYQVVDDNDQASLHIMGYVADELVAYARICPPQSVYPQPSIGRVVVSPGQRGNNYGRQVFAFALGTASRMYSGSILKIQAQQYLQEFYTGFGFRVISEPYPDFGILHVDMTINL